MSNNHFKGKAILDEEKGENKEIISLSMPANCHESLSIHLRL